MNGVELDGKKMGWRLCLEHAVQIVAAVNS
jgi:hypothetical protein